MELDNCNDRWRNLRGYAIGGMMDNKNYYKNEYLPQIIRIGKFTSWLGVIIVLLPPLVVTFGFGIRPSGSALLIALAAQLSINAVWWFIEPISFYPILGAPGTYMAFLSGNIGNLRIPCASAALKATNTKPATPEASIISSIGVSASVFVNIILLVIGVVVGSNVIAMLPEQVQNGFNFLIPAMFGALMMQFAVDDIKTGVVAMLLAAGSMVIYNMGGYNWFPIDPFVPNLLVPIIGSAIFAKYTVKIEDDTNEENTIEEK